MRAEISCGVYALPPMSVDQEVPMWRLTERTVRSALVTAWRLATSPTSTSSDLDQVTTEGVVRAPSALAMTVGSPPSMTDTTELVVPRSMPTALAMSGLLQFWPRGSGPSRVQARWWAGRFVFEDECTTHHRPHKLFEARELRKPEPSRRRFAHRPTEPHDSVGAPILRRTAATRRLSDARRRLAPRAWRAARRAPSARPGCSTVHGPGGARGAAPAGAGPPPRSGPPATPPSCCLPDLVRRPSHSTEDSSTPDARSSTRTSSTWSAPGSSCAAALVRRCTRASTSPSTPEPSSTSAASRTSLASRSSAKVCGKLRSSARSGINTSVAKERPVAVAMTSRARRGSTPVAARASSPSPAAQSEVASSALLTALTAIPAPTSPTWTTLAATMSRSGRTSEHPGIPPDHHRQGARGGTGDPPGDGSIEVAHAELLQPGRHLPRPVRGPGGVVEPDHAGPERGG